MSRAGAGATAVLAIARNTFREAVRNKVLYSLLFFAVLLILSALALGELSLNEGVRMTRDLGLFGIDLFSVLIAIFVGVNLLYKELDADDGELTRTRKVRRGVVAEKYDDIIEAIYAGRPAIDIDTMITFQDGTRQRIRTRLDIVDLATAPAPAVRDKAA